MFEIKNGFGSHLIVIPSFSRFSTLSRRGVEGEKKGDSTELHDGDEENDLR